MAAQRDHRRCRFPTGFVASALLIAPVGLLMMPERARADAALDITVTMADPAFWLDNASIEVVVSNPGTEPLSSVVVVATLGDAAWSPIAPLTGPDVLVGDAGDVLDPGEVWSYTATMFNKAYGESWFEVTATAPDASEVSAEGRVAPQMIFPAEAVIESDVTSVNAGDAVRWVVSAINVADFAFEIDFDGRVLFPEWRGPIPNTSLGEPIERGGNGDQAFDPGETWRWEFIEVVTADRSYLEVSVAVSRAEAGAGGFGDVFVSPPLTVTAPQTTTQPTTPAPGTTQVSSAPPGAGPLPETGLDETTVVSALVITLLGTGLLIVSRRRRQSPPQPG